METYDGKTFENMHKGTFIYKHANFTLKGLYALQEHIQVHITTTIRHIHIHVQE